MEQVVQLLYSLIVLVAIDVADEQRRDFIASPFNPIRSELVFMDLDIVLFFLLL